MVFVWILVDIRCPSQKAAISEPTNGMRKSCVSDPVLMSIRCVIQITEVMNITLKGAVVRAPAHIELRKVI
jgi:hypothetical protein